MSKKYSVNEAIWIAAAVNAFKKYHETDDVQAIDLYLKTTQLINIAKLFTENDVQPARIHQHCNGFHEKCTHRYLNKIELVSGGPYFAVSYSGQFNGEREYPDTLDMNEIIEYEGNTYKLEDVKNFISTTYAEFIQKHTLKINNSYWPSLEEYDPGISSEKWIELLTNPTIVNENILCMLYYMLELGGESTCAYLAEHYGGSAFAYNSFGKTLSERVYRETGCPLCKDGDKERFYTIPFVGRNVKENGHNRYSWKLRDELKEALESDMMIEVRDKIKSFNASKKDVSYDKNLILYGPPGTGKTYNSVTYAVKICEPDFDTSDYDKVMERYNQLKAEHRIAFTTFHQSYGYEEFIEGIRPVLDADSNELGYKIEPGVFKKFCEMARTPANVEVNPDASIWFMRLDSDNAKSIKDECFHNNTVIMDIKEDDDWANNRFVDMMQIGDYVISYAGNSVYIDAIGVIEGEAEKDAEKGSYQWSRKVDWTILDEKVDVKSINSDKYLPNFSIAKMSHMKVSDLLRLLPSTFVNEEKPYVFIIDEINRGNISKIFGELITLIETTKREGEDEAASAILPYSGQSFSVPSNVYILGTMNTADRSIQLMDTALRRRFSFIEMMPDAEVLRNMGIGELDIDGTILDVATMLEVINDRIAFLFDREHTIGHAFFTGLKEQPTIEKLASIFEKSVIPLLQEYFYEDYQKIQLVLGDNAKTDQGTKFILDKKVDLKSLFMDSVEDVVDEKEVKYEINSVAFRNIRSYKGIASEL